MRKPTTYHFKKIITNKQTEIVAKRRAIEEAMRYWDENENDYFVELDVTYNDTTIVGRYAPKNEVIIASREVISKYIGLEALWYWRRNDNRHLFLTKEEYLELWEKLRTHQKGLRGRTWQGVKEFVKGILTKKSKK